MAKLDEINFTPKTYVAIVLDKSGSMASISKFAVDTYNEQIAAIRESSKDQEVSITLVEFDSKVDFKVVDQDISEVSEMKMEDYIPGTMTALNDAIGLTIARLKEKKDIDDENVSVLIVAITDGAENDSKEYSRAAIAGQIKELQDTDRWTFTYLGANVDVNQISKDYGLFLGNVSGYDTNAAGVLRATQASVSSTTSYMTARSRGVSSSKSFYSDTSDSSDELLKVDNNIKKA